MTSYFSTLTAPSCNFFLLFEKNSKEFLQCEVNRMFQKTLRAGEHFPLAYCGCTESLVRTFVTYQS